MTKTAVQQIIQAPWLLTMAPHQRAPLADCAIAIDHGKIVAIAPMNEIIGKFSADETVILENHLVMPGLINGHNHAAMSLLRGIADDLPLMRWLEDHIWPAEQRWVDAEFVKDGTDLAIAEMIKSGTTCFSDMYFFPEVTADCARTAGIRAQITFPILDFPTPGTSGPDEAIAKGLALFDAMRSIDRIRIGFGPHAPYTVSDDIFTRIATLSAELDAPVQVHLHETQQEVDDALAARGERPIARLHQLGLLTPRTQCVHMTALNDDDIELIKLSGASVIHCAESNMKLASGFCPTQQLLDAGITLGLGTDGAASNNDLDLFGEMKSAALIAKGSTNNASAFAAYDALHAATLGGAKALGIDHLTGSLELGKAADLIAIDLDELSCFPTFNLLSTLVYTNISHRVSHAWVDGKALMIERRLRTLNESEIKRKARQWQARIQG